MQEEADLFFGRDRQSDELVRRLASSRFLAVVGTSGSGKSSLVRAGLLPSLEGGFMAGAGAHWRIAILRPQDDPIGFLARAIVETGVLAHLDLAQPAAEGVVETTLRRSSLRPGRGRPSGPARTARESADPRRSVRRAVPLRRSRQASATPGMKRRRSSSCCSRRRSRPTCRCTSSSPCAPTSSATAPGSAVCPRRSATVST